MDTCEWAKQTGSLTDGFKLHNRKWYQKSSFFFLEGNKASPVPIPHTTKKSQHLHNTETKLIKK